jgi:hypothetical protein
VNGSLSAPPASRSSFTAGRDLQTGHLYRCIATGRGEVVDSDTYLLTTDVVDKKGNRQMVNTGEGCVLFATPASIWSK